MGPATVAKVLQSSNQLLDGGGPALAAVQQRLNLHHKEQGLQYCN